jgi:exodeoxyribonuclease VII small subunit
MSDAAASPTTSDGPSFEEDLERLETIVETLDDEPDSLEKALELYEEGITIARRCMEQLEAADLRVQKLTLDDSPSGASS